MSLAEILSRPRRPADEQPEPRLQVVPDRPRPAARGPFVVLVLSVLGFGMVGLLLLNTSLQQGSFVIHDLEGRTADLADRQGLLEQRVAALRAPENLARMATRQGMVPNPNPAFLRLSDGKVLGEARPAPAQTGGMPPPEQLQHQRREPPTGDQTWSEAGR